MYYSINGVVITWLHVFPWTVSGALWVGALRPDGKKELILFCYSWYLTMLTTILWAVQTNLALVRPHELCGHIYPYAFPSIEAFLFGSLVAAFITYAWFQRIALGWLSYIFIYTATLVPQVFLVLSGYNRWWEVMVTFGFGLVTSTVFVSVFMLYIRPLIPYLETQAPCTWFHLTDTYCRTTTAEREQEYEIRQHIEACTRQISRLRRG